MNKDTKNLICSSVSSAEKRSSLADLLPKISGELAPSEKSLFAILDLHYQTYIKFGGDTTKIEKSLRELLDESARVESNKTSH